MHITNSLYFKIKFCNEIYFTFFRYHVSKYKHVRRNERIKRLEQLENEREKDILKELEKEYLGNTAKLPMHGYNNLQK